MKIIAHIETDFKEKFGIPRQSGLIPETKGKIIFEKKYRVSEAFRELEGYSHIWILWQFSEAILDDWSPTVRPPLLGGNKRVGVFATRSPFRPNPIGLSCVALEKIEYSKTHGPILHVSGADLLDHTPIYDIKPYLTYTDSHPDAVCGFADNTIDKRKDVQILDNAFYHIPKDKQTEILRVLSHDPRPSYKNDSNIYGMRYANYEIKFTVKNDVLTLTKIEEI